MSGWTRPSHPGARLGPDPDCLRMAPEAVCRNVSALPSRPAWAEPSPESRGQFLDLCYNLRACLRTLPAFDVLVLVNSALFLAVFTRLSTYRR